MCLMRTMRPPHTFARSLHRGRLVVFVAASAVAATGCKNRFVAEVNGITLGECSSAKAAPDFTATQLTKVLTKNPDADGGLVAAAGNPAIVAIERGVPWPRVRALLEQLQAAHKKPVLLCGNVSDVREFVMSDEPTGGLTIQMVVEPKGKFCVQTPEIKEAYCVQGSNGHIPRAEVRQTMRTTVKKWERVDVAVTIDPRTEWADVMRAIDGARTCCGTTEIYVALKHEGAAPYEFHLPGEADPDQAPATDAAPNSRD
jgi:hypothetical protein